MIIFGFLFRLSSAQNAFFMTSKSVELPGQEPYKGCAKISTPNIPTYNFDLSVGSVFGWPTNSTDVLHRCGDLQCLSCYVVEDTVTSDIELFIKSCHASVRIPNEQKRIPASSLCGYKDGLTESQLKQCSQCESHQQSEICKLCASYAVNCFQDCDNLLKSGVCEDPEKQLNFENCKYCSYSANSRSREQHPMETGGQFFYTTGDRVVEMSFINTSKKHFVTVGTDRNATYPGHPHLNDLKVIAPGESVVGFCYQGRFLWVV
jgi:hypothetical protein